MRIAISGAHGVGKTILARSLAGKLNLPLVEEVARSVAGEQGYKTTEQVQKAAMIDKIIFQSEVFCRQVREESKHWDFVSDRSVFDCVGYCFLYNLPSSLVCIMRDIAIEHSKNYDAIIYCPIPGEAITDDGFRLTSKQEQEKVDFHISMLLDFAKCPVLWLGENRDHWEEKVLEYIRGRKG